MGYALGIRVGKSQNNIQLICPISRWVNGWRGKEQYFKHKANSVENKSSQKLKIHEMYEIQKLLKVICLLFLERVLNKFNC